MYGKIFESIYDGTLYKNWEARVVFQDMIILASPEGILDKTPESLAGTTGIPLPTILKAIEFLEAPDPQSRTPDNEGRRIVRISEDRSWGWMIVNHEKYRNMRDLEERREQNREAQQRRRLLTRQQPSAMVSNGQQKSAYSDTDSDTDTKSASALSSAGAVPYGKFVQTYRSKCVPPMPDVKEINDARKKQIKTRWLEHPDAAFWSAYFEKAAASDFLTGRREGRDAPFIASFDWLIGPKNFVKVLEGNYDNRASKTGREGWVEEMEAKYGH